MFNKDELDGLLVNVGANIERHIDIYMIGGCALSFKGLKAATKDIDIIVANRSDFDVFDKAMDKEGFNYDVMYDEIFEQSKHGKRWFFWFYENLCLIENFNRTRVPIKNKVFSLIKMHWKERPSGFMSDV